MKKWIYGFLCVLAVGLMCLMAGCGGSNGAGDDVIRIGSTQGVPASVDPAKDWDGWYTVRYGVGETLFKLDKDLKPQPWLATKAEQLSPTEWKITLNDKVTFSNGKKMTADAVVASLKRVGDMNSRAKIFKEATYKVEGNTILITTPKPYATLVNDLCDPFSAIVDVADTKDFAKAPVMTGPFVMTAFEPNTKADMAKNEKYWDGQVKANRVEYKQVADFNTLAMALQSNELDIALDMSPASAATLANDKEVTVLKTTQPRTYLVYFNLEKMPDKAVREAVMYALDKQAIGEKQLKGSVTPANGAFLENSVFGTKFESQYNVDKAKALLKEAGYTLNDKGIFEKNGKPLTIVLGTYKRLAIESIATEMQAQLKKAGIDVQIVPHEKANFLAPGDFDMALYSVVTMPTGDAYAFLRDTMAADSKSNFGHYNNPTIQAALQRLSQTTNEQEKVQLVRDIQRIAHDDAAYDYIGFNVMYTGVSKHITGFSIAPNDYYQVTKDLAKQ